IAGGAWLVRPDGDKPAGKKTGSANAERLVERVNEAVDAGDLPAAKSALSQLTKVDPGSAAAKRLADQIKRAEAAPGQASSGDTTGGESKLDQPGATPLSVLPAAIDGYKVSNAWLREPTMAGGTYQPKTATMAQKVDRIFSTVVRSKTAKGAAASLAAEKSKFPDDKTPVKVNGNRAYSGTYGGMMTVAWVKGKWFFSIQVIPGGKPSVTFLRGVAVDVAKKLGV
ncbi:MAG: hypothetical protein Q8L35_05035, partial [Actinomycetota bacterium]|nr:hypothetical protein [Actinomycetota bacterium]